MNLWYSKICVPYGNLDVLRISVAIHISMSEISIESTQEANSLDVSIGESILEPQGFF